MREALVDAFPNEMEARLLAERLLEEGIRSVVKPKGAGSALAGTPSFVPHSVYVLEEYVQRAKEIAGGVQPPS